MTKRRTHTPIGLLALGLLLGTSNVAYAQSSDTGARILDEIIVTAQKKEENAQDVPISISAFSGAALEAIGITESDQLGQFVPGLEIGTSSGKNSQLILFLRGAGLSDFNNNNAGPIGIYSDEVYISSPILTSFQFFDTERLEVLKGPQGTLYGRNTTGGAVKFVTNKPTEDFQFTGRASYSSFDTTDFEAAVSGPLSDNVRGRLAISKNDSDGFIENLTTGENENGNDALFWRGMLDFDVTENLFVRANIHGASVNPQASKFNHLGAGPGNANALGYVAPEDPFVGEYNQDGEVDTDAIGGYLEAKYDFGGMELTSITAYDEADSLIEEETDASPLNIINIDYGVESKTFSQEVRLTGELGNSNWLVGGFYLTEDLDQNQTVNLFGDLRAFTEGLSDPFGVAAGAPILFARTVNEQDTESFAVFGQADFALSEKLTVTLGGRYTDESRDFLASAVLEDDLGFLVPDEDGDPITLPGGELPVYSFPDLNLSDSAFSWRAGLDYALNDNVLLYASAARGFKSGGFNGGFLSLDAAESAVQVQPYEPEFLTAYEVGFKSDLLDNRLRLNASVFLNDFKDLQVFTLESTGALPIQVLDNSSSAEVLGAEFDATFYPVDNFLLNLSASFLDSELQDFVANGGQDFSGNVIANTPKSSVSGLARYDHDLGENGSLHAQASFAYKSDVFFTTDNNPIASQDGYTLVNARVGYDSEDRNWGLAVFAKNLGDVTYFSRVTDLSDFGIFTRTVGTPRSYGVELTFDF